MSRPGDRLLNADSLATAGAVVEREFWIADFTRLAGHLARPTGAATARLALSRLEGVAVGTLHVRATAEMTCQRCLAPLRRVLEAQSRLAFVASETAPVPADHEAIDCDPHRLDLAGLVEDELLLALPLIARHAQGEACTLPDAAQTVADEPAATRRPFAGLKDLLDH